MWLYRRIIWWYLAAPVLLFLLQWYNHIIGFPLFCALLFGVDYVSQYSDSKDGARYKTNYFLLIPTIILTILVTWGALSANLYDWQKHRSLFYDLTQCLWPIGYVWNDLEYVMAYYVMYYLPSALVAKALGLQWLPQTVALWTVIGYGLVFWGYFSRSKNVTEWLVLFFILFSFGGWDILGWYFKHGQWPQFPEHLVAWNGLETNSNAYIFYWVPQHAIPAWLAGILLFRPEFTAQDRVRFGTLLLALVTYWSPLVGIGLFFFIAADVLSLNPFKAFMKNKIMFLMSFALVVPYYFYLHRKLASVYNTWTFYNWELFVPYYLNFLFFTVLIVFLVVGLLCGFRENRKYLLVCLCVLLISPLYCFGNVNDLAMRAPMTQYFFLLLIAGDGALKRLRKGFNGRHGVARTAVAAGILLISMASPINESVYPLRAIMDLRFFDQVPHGLMRLYANDDARYQYMSNITPLKSALMEDVELCLP